MSEDREQQESPRAAVVAPTGDQLEEIARRLVELHVSVASSVDGSIEQQRWTLDRLKSLMEYVDNAIDARDGRS